jgi:hypothetical protein
LAIRFVSVTVTWFKLVVNVADALTGLPSSVEPAGVKN